MFGGFSLERWQWIAGSRVTRLAEFSPFGRFYFGKFLKTNEAAHIFGAIFPPENFLY
jgi:hypothetical protein